MQLKLWGELRHLKRDFYLGVWDRLDLGGKGGCRHILHKVHKYFEFEETIQAPVGRHDAVKYSYNSFFVRKNIRDSAGAGRTRLD